MMDKTALKKSLEIAKKEQQEWEERYANDCSEYNRCMCHYFQGVVDTYEVILEDL